MTSTRTSGRATGDTKHEAHGRNNPAPEAGMSGDVINIGMNIFRGGTARYSEEAQEKLEWLWGYTYEELDGSRRQITEALGEEYSVIHAALTGKMDEDKLEGFLGKIEALKTTAVNSTGLVQTIVTRRITEALDYARDERAMVTVTGPTGRSKTLTCQWWAKENNHGRSIYVRLPSGCTRRTLVHAICRKCGIGVNGKKVADLEHRLFKAIRPSNVLILDEAGHLMPRTGTGTSAIELARDLHDICDCGVAMIFTDVYLKELKKGRLADYFEQFIGRIKYETDIPDNVLKEEIAAVVESFHPQPSAQLLKLAHDLAKNRDGRLRTLFEDLNKADSFARKENRELSAGDLAIAAKWRTSGGIWPEE